MSCLLFMRYFNKNSLKIILLFIAISVNLLFGNVLGEDSLDKHVNPKDIAKTYFERKEYTNAITRYKKASINNSNDMDIYEQIGRAC